jgi:hypothetical protein
MALSTVFSPPDNMLVGYDYDYYAQGEHYSTNLSRNLAFFQFKSFRASEVHHCLRLLIGNSDFMKYVFLKMFSFVEWRPRTPTTRPTAVKVASTPPRRPC